MEAAFGRAQVRLDFSGCTAETLRNATREPLGKIRDGRLTPKSI